MPPAVPAFLGKVAIQPVELPKTVSYPGLRPWLQESVLNERRAALKQAEAELTAARKVAEKPSDVEQRKLRLAEAKWKAAQAELVAATACIVAAVAAGELTPSQAAELSKVIDVLVRALESKDFDERLTKLENRKVENRPGL